ncbi:unnamed protein product [Cuscuta europaea]|uniref:Uncharacterized protein n=1 Tax=Cuscuta europaea TaxID=41803 RepID=A0A9P1E4E1_CUSEU|nr:unnamed protein product [Cuscuta europaea]
MSSASDSQDISRDPSVETETYSDVEPSSEESSAGDDAAVAMEVEKDLRAEVEAEDFEQVNEDEELALAVQTAEEEEEKERMKVTVDILSPRGAGESSSSRPNLQQVPEFRLFDDVPSSHKGWKERFCYVRLEENPFPTMLRNSFRRHPKVGSAALEKNGIILAKKPEGSDKHVKIKDVTLPEELFSLGFRQFRPRGSSDERYPPLDRVFEGAGGDYRRVICTLIVFLHVFFTLCYCN